MNYLFGVVGLSVPLVQEIVFLAQLEYDVLDCLKPPYYFIPKGSVPIENHAGHNLATHAKLENPKWLGVPRETSTQIVKQLIQKVLGRNVHIEQFSSRFLYSFQCDKQLLVEQNEKYGWGFNWSEKHLPCCIFDSQDRLTCFYCRQKQIKRINMNLFTELCILQCFNSPIAQLDVSQCIQLQQLYCDHTQIKELDVSQCTQLQILNCSYTQLEELDVSQCTQLQKLSCSKTQIQELDLSQCTRLTRLYCSNSPIEEIGLDKCTQLQYLNCSNTQVQKLDLVECPRLEDVFIGKCRNLETMYCLRQVQIHNKPKQTVVYLI